MKSSAPRLLRDLVVVVDDEPRVRGPVAEVLAEDLRECHWTFSSARNLGRGVLAEPWSQSERSLSLRARCRARARRRRSTTIAPGEPRSDGDLAANHLLGERRLAVAGGATSIRTRAFELVEERRTSAAARRSCACESVLRGLSPSSPSPDARHLDRAPTPNTSQIERRARSDRSRGRLVSGVAEPQRVAAPRRHGSSPVRSRNAIGIWRRRRTPSFWRSTSQCAFAVLGEIPRRRPISSFEQPAAIRATTSRCRCVDRRRLSLGGQFDHGRKRTPRSSDAHSSGV